MQIKTNSNIDLMFDKHFLEILTFITLKILKLTIIKGIKEFRNI